MYFADNYSKISYTREEEGKSGLRRAQLGAVHAIASHYSIGHQSDASEIIMPTGSGKSAVMMMAPYVLVAKKLLVVVPNVMLRGQLQEGFKTLELLKKCHVVPDDMPLPNICELKSIPTEIVSDLKNADIIISTHICAHALCKCDWAKENIDLVVIDEAHHTPAKTWMDIIEQLSSAKKILLTATPLRNDKKRIPADIIFFYSMRQAYEDGVFSKVTYIPIEPGENEDVAIAKKAEEMIITHRSEGRNEFVLVRTDKKSSAKELLDIYNAHTSLRLKVMDSSNTFSTNKKYIEELYHHELDGIICVNMLGEGFDFPNFKIAAIHAPKKTLMGTLQFIGRFVRTTEGAESTACFIAVNSDNLKIENRKLYAEDAVWNEMIIGLGDAAISEKIEEAKFINKFEMTKCVSADYFHLEMLNFACHTKIYQTEDFNIQADFPKDLNINYLITRNEDDEIVVGVGVNYYNPKWLSGDNKINRTYQLYVIHYQREEKLLHIFSQNHSKVLCDKLARSFCTNPKALSSSIAQRVLGEMNNYEIFSAGLTNMQSGSGEAYRVLTGANVSNVIEMNSGRVYAAGHVFCKAIVADGQDTRNVSIGFSRDSKVWSSEYRTLFEYIKWCDELGKKIKNNDIKIKTNSNYDLLPVPTQISSYPDKIFYAEFSKDTYSDNPCISFDESVKFLTDFEIKKIEKKDDNKAVCFFICYENNEYLYECDIKGIYTAKGEDLTLVGTDTLLSQYLTDNPLTFFTVKYEMICGSEIVKPKFDNNIFNVKDIVPIDWAHYNTNVKYELRTNYGPRNGKKSIQEALLDLLLSDPENEYVVFDHSNGEMADYLTFSETDNEIIARLYHVKGHKQKTYNNSVTEVYEVVGQAIKSIKWFMPKSEFIKKMKDRHKSGHFIMKKGAFSDLLKLIKSDEKRFLGEMVVVQPGLRPSGNMDSAVSELLASTHSYVKNAGAVRRVSFWGSP